MKTLYFTKITIFTLAVAGLATSLPTQFPMSAPTRDDTAFPASVFQGDSTGSLLFQLSENLNRGLPDGWRGLTQPPETSEASTATIQTIARSDLAAFVKTWGLDEERYDATLREIQTLVKYAIDQGIYVAQGFSYAWDPPQNSAPLVHLSNLIVTVRVPFDEYYGFFNSFVELGHVYVVSVAQTVQQTTPVRDCHFCWGRTCCHNKQVPRGLTIQELEVVKAVMSTYQSDWAIQQLMAQQVVNKFELSHHTPLPSSETASLLPGGNFDQLLRLFIDNAFENRDVFRPHKNDFLDKIHNETRSRVQNFHSMQLSANDENVVAVLQEIVTSCFERAGIHESVEQWWNRVSKEHDNKPISLECDFSSQVTESIIPPNPGCSTSKKVNASTDYMWMVITRRPGIADVLFMDGGLDIVYDVCEPEKGDDQDSTVFVDLDFDVETVSNDKSSGSVVRWAVILADGSFDAVQYLTRWDDLSSHSNKVLLDILRFASAARFLGIPVIETSLSIQGSTEVSSKMVDPSFIALMQSIKLFADTWSSVVKAFSSSTTTTVQRKICLGFESLSYHAAASTMTGIREENVPILVNEILKDEGVPNREELERIMNRINLSKNFTWSSESMIYTSPKGHQKFLFFAMYGGDVTPTSVDFAIASVESDFVLASDILVVREQSSRWGGLIQKDKAHFENIPHTLTLNDTIVLQMFWELVAYHQLANAMGLPSPKYPDLSGLCDLGGF